MRRNYLSFSGRIQFVRRRASESETAAAAAARLDSFLLHSPISLSLYPVSSFHFSLLWNDKTIIQERLRPRRVRRDR